MKPLEIATCPVCGGEYKKKSYRHKYCSTECYKKQRQKEMRELTQEIRNSAPVTIRNKSHFRKTVVKKHQIWRDLRSNEYEKKTRKYWRDG